MKKSRNLFLIMFLFLISFTFIKVNAATFDTMSAKYNQCVSENLSSYGAPNKNQICKLYSVTTGDSPVDTVFCLEAAKDIVWGTYTSISDTYDGMACAVLDIVNNSSLSSAIGINAYDWNGPTGSNIYINSYSGINLDNFVTIQKYIWKHAVNGTGTCTQKRTETRNLTAGSISTSNSTVALTKSGNNYVGSFTVTSSNLNGDYTYTANSSDVTLTRSGNTITISVPASKIDSVKNYTITISGSYNASQTLKITPFLETYKCIEGVGNCNSSSSYQTLGKIGFTRDITTTPKNISKTVNVTVTPTGLTLKKTDESGTILAGATVNVTKDGSDFQTITLTNGTYSFASDLDYGKYCVTEVNAPSGYVMTNISSCVTLSSTNPSGTITIKNKKTSVSFLKIDASTEKPLAGATLQILDKDGNVILDENNNPKYQWVSTTEKHIIDGLPVGTYYLKEVNAPSGYSLNSELIQFIINKDGSVISGEQKDEKTAVIIMENKKTVTSFSKQDATTGKELPGAILQILDKDKNEIKDKDGKVLYQWVSTDKPHIIEGLPVGIYYLKEVIQPEGYELSEELVKFEVKSDGTVTKVVMKNTPKIPVPDTALSKSGWLIAVGSIVGLLGIGLIIFTVMRKKNSKI